MPESHPFLNKLGRVVWFAVYAGLFRFFPRPFHRGRSFLLRCFGAQIASRCHIYASAKIWAPWNLECRSAACIADEAEIYNIVRVVLGEEAVVSQGALLCTASHDYVAPHSRWPKVPSWSENARGWRRGQLC